MADEAASSKCSANNQAKFSLFGFLFLFFTDTYCVHVDSSPSMRILLFFFVISPLAFSSRYCNLVWG